MSYLLLAFAAVTLPLPATANPPVFAATLGEKATGFRTLAECEEAIRRPIRVERGARRVKHLSARGSQFNRVAGNVTRCEMVDGEPLIVVIPRGL